jgi:hypothetical protein
MVIDPAGPAFIPPGAFSSKIPFFNLIRPDGNKIETGQVVQ